MNSVVYSSQYDNSNKNQNNQNNQNNLFYLVKNTLTSIDAIIFHHIKIYNNNLTLYSQINFNNNFNINNLVNLFHSILPHTILFNIYKNYNNYYIIHFKDINTGNLVLVLHLYTMNLVNYVNYSVETYFDVNNIINNYYGYSVIPNYHSSSSLTLTYDNIIQRIYNKKFCYLSHDMDDFDKFLEKKDYKLYCPISTILNKIIYASKLILIGWVMDEYIQKSWTINYYSTYKNYLNLIKFKNVSCVVSECDICNKKFNLHDMVFNSKNCYIHYDCLFSYLYKLNQSA